MHLKVIKIGNKIQAGELVLSVSPAGISNKMLKENQEQMVECQVCETIKESSPTPEGDEVCPNCGDREMLDKE